jgi:hypothetical protein
LFSYSLWNGCIALHLDYEPGETELARIRQHYIAQGCGVASVRVVESLRI